MIPFCGFLWYDINITSYDTMNINTFRYIARNKNITVHLTGLYITRTEIWHVADSDYEQNTRNIVRFDRFTACINELFYRKKKIFIPCVLKFNVHIVYTLHVIINIALCFQDVVVRVSFVLGNMTAKNEVARLRLFQEAGSFDILLSLFRFYLEQDVKVWIHSASALTVLCIT